MRLIPLPDPEGRPGDARLWINPEHITSIAPIVTRSGNQDGDVIILAIDPELEGLPMQRACLATCHTANEIDQAWQKFLDLIAGPDVPCLAADIQYLTYHRLSAIRGGLPCCSFRTPVDLRRITVLTSKTRVQVVAAIKIPSWVSDD